MDAAPARSFRSNPVKFIEVASEPSFVSRPRFTSIVARLLNRMSTSRDAMLEEGGEHRTSDVCVIARPASSTQAIRVRPAALLGRAFALSLENAEGSP